MVVAPLVLFIANYRQLAERHDLPSNLCGVLASSSPRAIGIPVGILGASSERKAPEVVQATIDTLQTLPSFVYLIPVVMLFQVGNFSAPSSPSSCMRPRRPFVTPTMELRGISLRPHRGQPRCRLPVHGKTLTKVKLPPRDAAIMLGVNQTT